MGRKRGLLLVVLAVLLGGVGVWGVRSRRATALDTGEPWRAPRPGPPARLQPSAPPSPPPPDLPAPLERPRVPVAEIVEAPEPAAAPAPSPRPRRTGTPHPPGAAAPLPDGSAPGEEFTIKGNAGSMLFHGPGSPYYGRTKAELWFRTADDARAAGFTEWTPKRRTTT